MHCVFFLRKQRTSGKRGKNKVKTHNLPSFWVVCEFVINSDTSVFEISKGALKDIFISVDSKRKIYCFCTKMKWKIKKKKKSREANYRDVDLTLIVKFSTNLVDYFQLTCSFRRYVLAVLKSQNNPFHMAKFEFCKRFTQSSVSFLWRNFNSKGVKVSYLFTCSWSSHNDGSTVKLDNSQQLSLFLQDSLYEIIEIAVPK